MGALRLTYTKNYRPLKVVRGNFYLQKNSDAERYEFGFNGQLKDNEIYGEGNAYDYGEREYNTRVMRLFSRDPLTGNFPYYSPYQFAGNKPISSIDFLGMQDLDYRVIGPGKNGGVEIFLFKKENTAYNSNKNQLLVHNEKTGASFDFFPFSSAPGVSGFGNGVFDALFQIKNPNSTVRAEAGKTLRFNPTDYYFGIDPNDPATVEKHGKNIPEQFKNGRGELKFYGGIFEVFPVAPNASVSGSLGTVNQEGIVNTASAQTAVVNAITSVQNKFVADAKQPLDQVKQVDFEITSDALKAYEGEGANLMNNLQKAFPGAVINLDVRPSGESGSGGFGVTLTGTPVDIDNFKN